MNVDPVKVLGYGVIGLGFLLALLAYRLLAKEQTRKQPEPSVLRAIYVFMAFSFALTAIGLGSEYIRLLFATPDTTAQKAQYDSETRNRFRSILSYIDRPVLESVRVCTDQSHHATKNTNSLPGCLAAAGVAATSGDAALGQIRDLRNQIHIAIGSPP